MHLTYFFGGVCHFTKTSIEPQHIITAHRLNLPLELQQNKQKKTYVQQSVEQQPRNVVIVPQFMVKPFEKGEKKKERGRMGI